MITQFLFVFLICSKSNLDPTLIGAAIRRDRYIIDFRENLQGIAYSGVFSNNAVLQREPNHAAIYGICDANVSIKLTLINEQELSDTTNKNAKDIFTTISMDNGDWKIIFPKTYENGGNYTVLVQCNECIGNPKNATLYNITFGDVYFCAGQSNMELEIDYTFSRNYTYANITELGRYSNIRFFKMFSLASNDTLTYVIPTVKALRHHWHQSFDIYFLKQFSATCWYTIQSLIDKYSMDNVNFGIIQAAIGGTMIEGWIMNNTVTNHCTDIEQIACPDIKYGYNCGAIYNGMIRPFINMTIKSILWYQGENNVFEGDYKLNTGYSCMQKLMIEQWRSNWSVVADTTDTIIPFGIVQLVPGSNEGYPQKMAAFRWAQQFNSPLPMYIVPNTFIAQTYDIGDPWGYYCDIVDTCKKTNISVPPYNLKDNPWKMGPIHARPKLSVGQRLAMGVNHFIYKNNGIWQGPVVTSCQIQDDKIICKFNQTMLYDESITIQPFKLWYNHSVEETVKNTAALEVLIDGSKPHWKFVNNNALSVGSNRYDIEIDISNFVSNKQVIIGVRYAWSDSPCCGTLNITLNPCPMQMCPIVTSNSYLPAMPFYVYIDNNWIYYWIFEIVVVLVSFCCCCCGLLLGCYYWNYVRNTKTITHEITMLSGGCSQSPDHDAVELPLAQNDENMELDFSPLVKDINDENIDVVNVKNNDIEMRENINEKPLIDK
eukprot:279725_1